MDSGTTTRLITVGATLGGVVPTLLTNTFVESRELKATQRVEAQKRATDQATWLRDERVKAYNQVELFGTDEPRRRGKELWRPPAVA
jgi:hypothetical protein